MNRTEFRGRRRIGARPTRSERGAAAVEAAIITPLLILVFFGIIEFGLLFRDYLGLGNATLDGVRTASVAGTDYHADYRTLRAIARGASSLPDGSIDRIVIWKASGPDDTLPVQCTGMVGWDDGTEECNVYGPEALNYTEAEFGCDPLPNPRPDPDRFWCPKDRVTTVGVGLDYIGIQIEMTHDFVTGLLGSSKQITETAVLKVEPDLS